MFFGQASEIAEIAGKVGTSVFVVSRDVKVEIKNAIILQPEDKSVTTIEQVRNVLGQISTRQTSDIFVVIRPADAMGEAAANAFLKSLEEPREKVHFVLITEEPSRLLPTILSRAMIYFLRPETEAARKINADEKVMALAKKLIVAKPQDLTAIAEEITRKKTNVRQYALDILGVAIEVLYKTYLINQKSVFLDKIPKFLDTYDAVYRNGHIKLHLVADLM